MEETVVPLNSFFKWDKQNLEKYTVSHIYMKCLVGQNVWQMYNISYELLMTLPNLDSGSLMAFFTEYSTGLC